MPDQTEEYQPPPPPTGDHHLTRPALIVAFQQLAGFEPYALERPDIIGRKVLQEAAHAVLRRDLEDPSVSREHARLERSQGGPGIVSLECVSSRGLTLNGWPMKQGERATLFGGEVLRMGGTLLTYVKQLPLTRREDLAGDRDLVTSAGSIVGPYGLRAVRAELQHLARTHARVVLVHGETGTGKEVLAHAVAATLGAKDVVVCNVAMIPRDQVAAELFGVAEGAFTGVRARPGAVRDAAAKKGALFLDEIGDLPFEAQVALLRFLQDGEIQPLGAKRDAPSSERKVSVPVVLATHRDVDKLVETGAFRADLVARIQQRIEIPPLRERSYDALPILLHIWANRRPVETERIPTDAIEALLLAWHEDNVRGLNRLAIEAEKRSPKRLTIDAAMVKSTLRNRGNSWWRAALCPSAVAEALKSAPGKRGGSPSQLAALEWLNARAVGQPISEGSFKRFLGRPGV